MGLAARLSSKFNTYYDARPGTSSLNLVTVTRLSP